MKNNIVLVLFGLLIILFAVFFAQKDGVKNTPDQTTEAQTFKDVTYDIDGQSVTLKDGVSVETAAPGSASNVTTQYFGNEVEIDLDGDGRDDIAFILTQSVAGSGTFYYAAGAVATDDGYVGTEAYLLGDRIAPQTTEISQNPRHKHVVVFNYADRAKGEPMTATPSVGKSVYLKLVPESMQWAIVEPDFEGEAAYACTMDAKICPDGSAVGRQGPNCEFAACPADTKTSTQE